MFTASACGFAASPALVGVPEPPTPRDAQYPGCSAGLELVLLFGLDSKVSTARRDKHTPNSIRDDDERMKL